MPPPGKSTVVRVEQGHSILLTGPARIKVSEGSAECFAAPLKSDDWLTVEEGRQRPILATDRCVTEIMLSHGGSWKVVSESTIPTGWSEAAQVVQQQRGVTAIVGEVDSGKSSLCTFLANKCVRDGLKVGIVDGDVGQADIGPPTTVSSAQMSDPVFSLPELQQESAFFVGDTSPSSVPSKLIRSLVGLKEDIARSADVVLLNTDGWIVEPAALRFKEEMVNRTRPDLVLGLGVAEEIDPLLNIIRSTSMRLSSSSYASTRSKEERKNAREAGYRRSLLGSRTIRISQDYARLRMFDLPEQSILRWDRSFRGFLAGLLDHNERLLGIGRIREIMEGSAVVETRATEQASLLEIGNIVLSSSYEETGYGALH